MRFLPIGLILLCTLQLFAQKDPYYIQQAPAPEQMALDCYQKNLEEGLSAQRRGDCRLALRWFRDAQSCPEVLKMPGRDAEIQALIDQCNEKNKTADVSSRKQAEIKQAPSPISTLGAAPDEAIRRRFKPSRQFLLYDKPECFDITCREAARAFAGGYWDDAAALYRAAKNCTDADQSDRLEANRRITACKAASQDELRKKEQEAIRQARHAIAANRANDADELLRNLNRSLAFRLADFANEYIAPDDNDACRQSMFNALYYTPSVHSGLSNDLTKIPFCYQLGDNLDSRLYVRFLGSGKRSKICAFAPGRHLLFKWDANSFEPEVPVQMEDTTLVYMDAVPDGQTLLFISENAYLFWRSSREVFRLPVRDASLYCFSANGETFYFLDRSEMQVYALDLSDAFITRKGFAQRASPEPTGIKVEYGIRQIAGGNGQFWLGYPDSIISYTPQRNTGSLWGRDQAFILGYYTPDVTNAWLDPLARTAAFSNDSMTVFFNIPESDTALVPAVSRLYGKTLAVGSGAKLIASYLSNLYNDDEDSRLNWFNPYNGQIEFGTIIHAKSYETEIIFGAFSSDNHMLATSSPGGKLVVWMLDDGKNTALTQLGYNKFVVPNADGSVCYMWRDNLLLKTPVDQPDKILESVPTPEDAQFPYLLAGQKWLAYRTGPNSVVLTDDLNLKRFTIPSPKPKAFVNDIVGEFDENEQFFCCLKGTDSVAVYDLETGQIKAERDFGGRIHKTHFVPGTGEVLVVHEVELNRLGDEQLVIKLWNPELPAKEAIRSVRLQGYETREVAFSGKNGLIAFTDGIDIRVFRQNDLLDEIIRIRQNGTHMVTAMRFYPDGAILAAGYEDGSVVFWDINTGQARFNWAKLTFKDSLEDLTYINRLRFIDNGRRLQIYLQENRLLTKDLAISLIRAGVQSDFRRLISFEPNQIREYNLEQALDYPDNFTRLAASGDLPLIRSFFDYFRETALYSNNIQRVGNSCNRAAILFGQLDAGTQNVLRPILLEMFEDYHWKLILRNQVVPAQKVANAMKTDFGNPMAAVLAAAHTALLRGDKQQATQIYAEWAFRSANSGLDGLLDRQALDSLNNRVLQLLEYELIGPDQFDCLCGLFGSFKPFDQRCKEMGLGNKSPVLDGQTSLRWEVFKQLAAAQTIKNHSQRVKTLEDALNNTRKLLRQDPEVYQRMLETVLLAYAKAYADLGEFERNTDRALDYFQRAIEILYSNGGFRTAKLERTRLSNLVGFYLKKGNVFQNRDDLIKAISTYRQGMQEATRLLQIVESDQSQTQKIHEELTSRLQLQLGMVFLLQGNAPEARRAFETAMNDRAEGIHRLYFGHTELLEGNKNEAFLEYGNIRNDYELGLALYDIEQIAAHLPDQNLRLTKFLHLLRSTRLQSLPQLDSTKTDYQWAFRKFSQYGAQAQWDSAYFWSIAATGLALQVFERPEKQPAWQNLWLNAQLNQAYFLLFVQKMGPQRFTEVIRLAQEAENYLESAPDANYYEFQQVIKTNKAHAFWLRNQPGDREQALELYRSYMTSRFEKDDTWEVLLKDFRDLRNAGVHWSGLAELIPQIKPAEEPMVASDWEGLGLEVPEE